MAKTRAHVVIHGRVHGVGFRFSTCDKAEHYGLTGWVRNTWDRTVEAVFEGEETDVKDMVEWCRRGPMLAHVTKLELEYSAATGEFREFRVTG